MDSGYLVAGDINSLNLLVLSCLPIILLNHIDHQMCQVLFIDAIINNAHIVTYRMYVRVTIV